MEKLTVPVTAYVSLVPVSYCKMNRMKGFQGISRYTSTQELMDELELRLEPFRDTVLDEENRVCKEFINHYWVMNST